MFSARLPRVGTQRCCFRDLSWLCSDPLPEEMGAFWGEGRGAEPKATEMDCTQKDPTAAFACTEAQTPMNNHCPQGSHCLLCASSFCQLLFPGLTSLAAPLLAKSPNSSGGSSFT